MVLKFCRKHRKKTQRKNHLHQLKMELLVKEKMLILMTINLKILKNSCPGTEPPFLVDDFGFFGEFQCASASGPVTLLSEKPDDLSDSLRLKVLKNQCRNDTNLSL